MNRLIRLIYKVQSKVALSRFKQSLTFAVLVANPDQLASMATMVPRIDPEHLSEIQHLSVEDDVAQDASRHLNLASANILDSASPMISAQLFSIKIGATVKTSLTLLQMGTLMHLIALSSLLVNGV